MSLISHEERADVTNYRGLVAMYMEVWEKIFSIVNKIDKKKPLTPEILSDSNNDFVKTLIYIYSMESFVFKEMNKASRQKDRSKIKMYGPFASALGFIIHHGNKN